MEEEKDKTLQNTMVKTEFATRNTEEAVLRRKIIALNGRYKNPEITKKVLYKLDGYSPAEIQAEMDNYNSIEEGKPLKEEEDTLRVEDRQRQMMYNDIVAELHAVDPKTGEKTFDPNNPGDVAGIINDLSRGYEGISFEEVVGAVNERLGGEPEENIASDFQVGEPAGEATGESALDKFKHFATGGDTGEKVRGVARSIFMPDSNISEEQYPGQWANEAANPQQTYQKGGQPMSQDLWQPEWQKQGPEQQVKGATWEHFKEGAGVVGEALLRKEASMPEPPSTEGAKAIRPGEALPAEERYPDKVVESWDMPEDEWQKYQEETGLKDLPKGKMSYEESRRRLKDIDVLSDDYESKKRTVDQVPQEEIETYKQKVREVFGEDADMAIAIMLAESKGVPEEIGDRHLVKERDGEKNGDSVGLFQIRTGGDDFSRPKALGIPIYQFRNDMFDPDQNIRYAKRIFDRFGWKPWTTYVSGDYKQYLNKTV